MEILGIGPLELIVILIVALAVFGPDKLPEIGAKLGRGMRDMRRATRDFSREIEAARDIADEIKQPIADAAAPFLDAAQTAGAIGQAFSNPNNLIRDSVLREMNRPDAPAEGADAVVGYQPAAATSDDLPVAAEATAVSAADPSAPTADDLPAAAEATAVSAADQSAPEPVADDLPPTVEAVAPSAAGEAPPPTSED